MAMFGKMERFVSFGLKHVRENVRMCVFPGKHRGCGCSETTEFSFLLPYFTIEPEPRGYNERDHPTSRSIKIDRMYTYPVIIVKLWIIIVDSVLLFVGWCRILGNSSQGTKLFFVVRSLTGT